ncbi:SDR family oxidoreductase [Dactylosporangium roseum]
MVVAGRTPETVDAAVDALGPEHAAGLVADLGDPDAGERLVELANTRFGRLDGALVSVGGPPRGGVLDSPEADWLAAFQTVFLGTLRTARVVADAIGSVAEGEDAAIAVVLSTSVRVPIDGLAISNGLRPGLAGVVKDLSDELGPRGIRVVSLLPGRVLTDRNRELFAGSDDPDRAAAAAAKAIPLRRFAAPAEFGRVAAFVLSPAAGYVTGIALPVDGGLIRAV